MITGVVVGVLASALVAALCWAYSRARSWATWEAWRGTYIGRGWRGEAKAALLLAICPDLIVLTVARKLRIGARKDNTDA